LHGSNQQLANLKKWRQEQYELFWFGNGQLRSWTAINDILIEMDAAETGQSGKFFASAVELVQLILAIDTGSLETYEWYPKYEYTTDANGQIRMIEPDIGGGE
jgi:hypothetical protein